MIDFKEEAKEVSNPPLALYEVQMAEYDKDKLERRGFGWHLKADSQGLPNTLQEDQITTGIFNIGDQYLLLRPTEFEGGPRYVEITGVGKKRIRQGGNDSPATTVVKMQDQKIPRRVVAAKLAEGTAYFRILEEARNLAGFNHPNIAKIYDIALSRRGEGIFGEAGMYIITEWLDGLTLDDWIETNPPLMEIAKTLDDITSEISYINSKSFVYADLKPDNVVFDSHGVPKLIDLELSEKINSDGLVKSYQAGNFNFAPPEQRHKGELSLRTDVYSFAATVCRLLSGGERFEWTNPIFRFSREDHQIEKRIKLSTDVEQYFKKDPEQLNKLKQILAKGLSEDPSERQESIEVINRELQAVFNAILR